MEEAELIVKFPWKRGNCFNCSFDLNQNARPGEYVLQTLFLEFCSVVERKIEQVLAEPLERFLSRSLQRNEDSQFDQILSALGCVAEQSLPSLLQTLFKWYERQSISDDGITFDKGRSSKTKGEKDFLCERRELAVEFVYCLALIEILPKLIYHPGHDDLVNHIIAQSFRHFKYKDGIQSNPNAANINLIADLYAEVVGVLAQSRFSQVRKTFVNELKELKLRDQTPYTTQSIISLLMGLKFFRVKMHPIEDFQACLQFLHELGHYFLEVKDRDIRHALSMLFVEILLPVAANVKNEVNVPVLKNFVEMLYTTTIDMATKKKHTLHLFPLVTCLLCVSQKQFFFNNWPYFLTMCLSQLKNKDPKMSRVALESLYRLLWVYMVRIKCESNTATISRLQSIVNSLFPKGSKLVTPRDTPLNIFVKIIQFIAKERLDFAMKEIIFDLLCIGRPIKFLTPERMSIGLRAFLVIADSLQQKDGDPPMPQSAASLPSGNTVRVKRTFLNKMLKEDTAKNIGLACYYPHILKAFDSILRALDLQVGRAFLLTKAEHINKEAEEIITGDRKPKIDLFHTCVAAIPRLLPDTMTIQELVEMLTRLTVHMDEELKGLAFQALQNLMHENVHFKQQVIKGFVLFIQRDISDTSPSLLDGTLRMLVQLLVHWKNYHSPQHKASKKKVLQENQISVVPTPYSQLTVLHDVEGLALTMLCSIRLVTRKLALLLLKEVHCIFTNSGNTDLQANEVCLLSLMDRRSPATLKNLLQYLPFSEKVVILTTSHIDLQWVLDRAATVWSTLINQESPGIHQYIRATTPIGQIDPWIHYLVDLVSSFLVLNQCQQALAQAWNIIYIRLQALFPFIDPSVQTNDNRTSLILRSGSKKVTNDGDFYLHLWHNYVILACTLAQQVNPHQNSSIDSNGSLDSINNNNNTSEKSESKSFTQNSESQVQNLFRMLVPLLKCDNSEMKDYVVNALGHTNPAIIKDLLEELLPFIKEANDKKADKVKQRRKRDLMRSQLARIFELMAENKILAQINADTIENDSKSLHSTFLDYIEGARLYLESENEKDLPHLKEIRLHFSRFIQHLINNTPLKYRATLLSKSVRYSLFHLFANWSGRFSHIFPNLEQRILKEEQLTNLEVASAGAMSAVLCCGPVFDQNGLSDDGYIYTWLNTLLSCQNERIYLIAKETVVFLLDFNPDVLNLLDWVIDQCYTGANVVADCCLSALTTVFLTREYPCDHVSMLNLAVINVGNPRLRIHETALQLLQLLDTRFFQEDPVFTDSLDEMFQQQQVLKAPLNDIQFATFYSRSQEVLAEQLAILHPDYTMPMFSEITHRFQTAKPALRQILLSCLLPWLYNMELVDPNICTANTIPNIFCQQDTNNEIIFKSPLKGEGWGSTQATEMVLNNLFYITVKFGDDHPKETEALWTALVMGWPHNLQVIIQYMVVISNLASSTLLVYIKRVMTYLGRAMPERLVEHLMVELKTVETLNQIIERTQTPPFYRLGSIQHSQPTANSTDDEKLGGSYQSSTPLEKGMLHTKRHSANEDITSESSLRTESTTSLRSISSVSSVNSIKEQNEDDINPHRMSNKQSVESPVPYPLPMPAYGGYFAPMSQFLPEKFTPTSGFHRSNLGIIFLSELVLDGLDVDWNLYLPLILHITFLGLDHNQPLIYEHCKKLLENVLLLLVANEHPCVARLLIDQRKNKTNTMLLLSTDGDLFSEETISCSLERNQLGQSTYSLDSNITLSSVNEISPHEVNKIGSLTQAMETLLTFINSKSGKPLWSHEDITPKTLVTASSASLEYFLKLILRIFRDIQSLRHIEPRWSQIALQLALSCSSRHYAGRSFQILRALKVRPSTQMLNDILSRLVVTVSEQGEDMQGYVTEIMLTLEALVNNLELEHCSFDNVKDLSFSTPNLTKHSPPDYQKNAFILSKPRVHTHRTSSYLVSVNSSTATENQHPIMAQSRSSTQPLKVLDQNNADDKLSIVSQLFWIAVSMLESDYEYEFYLAIRLLDKILKHLQLKRADCQEKLQKILQQIKWNNFPGVQNQLLKGCTSPTLTEPTWLLLSKLILFINAPIMDPQGLFGFPMNVIAVLPYLIHYYENPNKKCRMTADNINQMCAIQSDKLQNLATVMSLYSGGTFSKDSFQWTRCVVKYLLDVYSSASLSMISFLVEVLEKGPTIYQPDVLQILHCIIHYVDFQSTSRTIINQQLFSPVAKLTHGTHWKEALKILKLAVTRSSTLALAPPTQVNNLSSDMNSLAAHTAFAESGLFIKKELPGLTLDFDVDLSKTSLIGQKYINVDILHHGDEEKPVSLLAVTRKSSTNIDWKSSWKKPHLSQTRTRERLINLLTCFGQNVGLLKSPSVIFSQSNDNLEHDSKTPQPPPHHPSLTSSENTSLHEVSSNDALLSDPNGNELLLTFKGFDFLDNELEEAEDYDKYFFEKDYFIYKQNDDYFSLGDRRQSLNLEASGPSSLALFGSVPDLKLLGTFGDNKSLTLTESVSMLEEGFSDEESQTSGPDDTGAPNDLPCNSTITLPNQIWFKRSVPSFHSRLCLNHEMESFSDDPTLLPFCLNTAIKKAQYFNIQSDEVYDAWKSHLSKVIKESSPTDISSTCHIFPRLYKELWKRLTSFTKEACYYIAKSSSLYSLTQKIMQTLNLLFSHVHCPFVFMEPNVLLAPRDNDRHKFCVLEIHECLHSYNLRKDLAEQCLSEMKSIIKQESIGEVPDPNCCEKKKGEMCRHLYKLIFQLMLLFESFTKVNDIFQNLNISSEVVNLSGYVTTMRKELSQIWQEVDNGQVSPLSLDPNAESKQEAISCLLEDIHAHRYLKALQLLRLFRSQWPGDVFGMTSEDDIAVLMNIYCISVTKKTGLFVCVNNEVNRSKIFTNLMEISALISMRWTQLACHMYKSDLTPSNSTDANPS